MKKKIPKDSIESLSIRDEKGITTFDVWLQYAYKNKIYVACSPVNTPSSNDRLNIILVECEKETKKVSNIKDTTLRNLLSFLLANDLEKRIDLKGIRIWDHIEKEGDAI